MTTPPGQVPVLIRATAVAVLLPLILGDALCLRGGPVLAAVAAAPLALFALRGRALDGALALLVLFSLHAAAGAESAYTNKENGMPVAALTTYILAFWLARSEDDAQAQALDAAAGVIGAAYAWAGASKLLNSSAAEWCSGNGLRGLAAAQAAASADWFAGPREWLARSPSVAAAAATAALVIELAGPLQLSRRARAWHGAGVLALHAGVGAAMGLVFWNWMLVVFALSVEPALRSDPRRRAPGRPRR